MAVSKRLRFEVLKRDNHTCRYCGGTSPDVRLTIDHVVPVALGGSNDPTNLVAACADCNAGKSSVPANAPLVADIASDAMRWAYAMECAAAGASYLRYERDQIRTQFREHWGGFTYGYNKLEVPIDGAWAQSVDQLLQTGLTVEDLIECIDIAMAKQKISADDTWRYFCGVAWRMLSQRQELAQQIASSIAADEVL
jgi:hypothetical protein